MSTPKETVSKFEQVVIPCTGCSHESICKYSYKCNDYASKINKEIDNLNAFLEDPSASTAPANGLFTVSMYTAAVLPSITLSCKFFAANETYTAE